MIESLPGLPERLIDGIAVTASAKEITEMIEAFIVVDLRFQNDR
jgi:hypothetical protein